jgi:hypothetical protein
MKIMADVFNADLYLENLEKELFGEEEDITEKYLEYLSMTDDYMTEGFNKDLNAEYEKDLKEIKEAIKSAKKDIKKKDFDSARATIKSLDKKLDENIKAVKKYEGSVS